MSAPTFPILTRRDPRVKARQKKEYDFQNHALSRTLQAEKAAHNERTARPIASSPLHGTVPLARTKSEERIIAEREKKVHCSKIRNGTRNWSAKSNREQIDEVRKEVNDKLRQKIEMKQKHAEEKRKSALFERKVKAATMQQISRLNASMTDIWE